MGPKSAESSKSSDSSKSSAPHKEKPDSSKHSGDSRKTPRGPQPEKMSETPAIKIDRSVFLTPVGRNNAKDDPDHTTTSPKPKLRRSQKVNVRSKREKFEYNGRANKNVNAITKNECKLRKEIK